MAIKQVSSESAVIISTSSPDVAKSLSTRSIILHKGHIVRMGTLKSIIESSGGAGIYISCFYDMKRMNAFDPNYFSESSKILSTHEEILSLLEYLAKQLELNECDEVLDF